MEFLKNALAGFIIGIGGLAPGSGGALFAMIIGVYDKMIEAIGNFFRDIKKNILFLLPIGIGALLGIVCFSNLLASLLDKYPMQTMFSFTGLIIGTFPILFRKANKGKFHKRSLIFFFIAFSVSFLLAFADVSDISTLDTVLKMDANTWWYLLLAGFGLAGSLIFPGVSGTVLMIMMGIYKIMIRMTADLKNIIYLIIPSPDRSAILTQFSDDLSVLVPVAIGLAVGAIIFSKILNFALKKSYSLTYYAILGFIAGSTPKLVINYIPKLFSKELFTVESITSIILFIVFIYISSLLDKWEHDALPEKDELPIEDDEK